MPLPAEISAADTLLPQPPQLGPRLDALYQWIAQAQRPQTSDDCMQTSDNCLQTSDNRMQPYDNLWDCCCDHGYLGIHLLKNALCPRVHLVDQASHLIDALHPRMATYGITGYRALSADASELRFAEQQTHLIIIAGVGGEHTVDIVRAIIANHPHQSLDFMFCPTTTQFDLREYLAQAEFQLLHETLVSEKGREYEVICVRHTGEHVSGCRVSRTGEHWTPSDPAHRRYLTKLITHYRRCTLGSNAAEAQRILDHYLATWDRLAL